MNITDTASEYVVAAGKASPPLAVTSAVAAGWTLQDWVLVATLLYTLLQIAVLVVKTYKGWRSKRDGG